MQTDNPIESAASDLLSRAGVAAGFARQVVDLDRRKGLVVGVLGPWGSGKTSFLNLTRQEFELSGSVLIDFNPWMFSGSDTLVDAFFQELSAELKLRTGLLEISKKLAEYGQLFSSLGWIPFAGRPFEAIASGSRALEGLVQRHRGGVRARAARVSKVLADLDAPIVVFIDDIDRLDTAEIRSIFKLVRLVASFPNLVYVLAFDRARVEGALEEPSISGRDYLAKILQLAVDIPAVPRESLRSQTFDALNEALAAADWLGEADEQAWPDVYAEVVEPLICNLRDVRRYAIAVQGTVSDLSGRVALSDLLALEAVRIFLPDTFARIRGSADLLTQTAPSLFTSNGKAGRDPAMEALLSSTQGKQALIEGLIARLFPAARRHLGGPSFGSGWGGTWLRQRRVADPHVLALYLERVAGGELSEFEEAERIFAVGTDANAMRAALVIAGMERAADVIARLENFEADFTTDHARPFSIALLSVYPDLEERDRGFFSFGSDMVITRVLLRVLQRVENPEEVSRVVHVALSEVPSLSGQLLLVSLVGHEEGVGHGLVTTTVAEELEAEWHTRVMSASAETLAAEKDLLRVLYRTSEIGKDQGHLRALESEPVVLALLRSSLTYSRSQSMGSRAVRKEPRLQWEALASIFGSELALCERIDAVLGSLPDGELSATVAKYRGGWRPQPFSRSDER